MSRGKGGDLGWVSIRSLGSDQFAKQVMSQPLHLISKPIETENAWHIAQAYAERGAGPVPIDNDVRLDIAGVPFPGIRPGAPVYPAGTGAEAPFPLPGGNGVDDQVCSPRIREVHLPGRSCRSRGFAR